MHFGNDNLIFVKNYIILRITYLLPKKTMNYYWLLSNSYYFIHFIDRFNLNFDNNKIQRSINIHSCRADNKTKQKKNFSKNELYEFV